MSTTPAINLTELDFNKIKDNLIAFLKTKPEYQDYAFEASGWQYLLDLLCYPAAMNAFYTNMMASEMFLDTAQLRDSVVSKAKLLGYLPQSKRSAQAELLLKFTPESYDSIPASLNIVSEAAFSGTTTENVSYNFILDDAITLTYSADYYDNQTDVDAEFGEDVITVGRGAFLKSVTVKEGTKLIHRYDVTSELNQKFSIPNSNVDTESIVVQVQADEHDATLSVWTRAEDITELDSTSQVYFIQVGNDNLYEIYFGDDIISANVQAGNIVIISYIACNGPLANGIKTFEALDEGNVVVPVPVSSEVVLSLTTVAHSTSGADEETIADIKKYAPINYELQNRAVTKLDFEQLVLQEYSNAEAVSAWGGEEEPYPQYGKVFISIKPKAGYILDTVEKDYIVNTILRPRCVVTQSPEIVDPDYLYMIVNSLVKFTYRTSTYTRTALQALVYNTILNYSNDELEKFGRGFNYSKLVDSIDAVDSSIRSNLTDIFLKKYIYPTLNVFDTYVIDFNNELAIYNKSSLYTDKAVYSSTFKYTSDDLDCLFAEDSFGSTTLSIFKIINGATVEKVEEVGTIDYNKGIVTVSKLFAPTGPTTLSEIYFIAKPVVNDLISSRNNILVIDTTDIHVSVDEVS